MLIFAHVFAGALLGLGFWHLTIDRRAIPLCIAASILPDLIDKSLGLLFPLILGGKNGVPFPDDRRCSPLLCAPFHSVWRRAARYWGGICNSAAPDL